jgi:hypothetical protein
MYIFKLDNSKIKRKSPIVAWFEREKLESGNIPKIIRKLFTKLTGKLFLK